VVVVDGAVVPVVVEAEVEVAPGNALGGVRWQAAVTRRVPRRTAATRREREDREGTMGSIDSAARAAYPRRAIFR
jgi:hypothetical protein